MKNKKELVVFVVDFQSKLVLLEIRNISTNSQIEQVKEIVEEMMDSKFKNIKKTNNQ